MATADKWAEMVSGSRYAIEDFNDFTDDKAIVFAADKILQLTAEVERLNKRDCNATVELCYATDEQPFEREQLQIVDVGVSDNVYVVESDVLTRLQEDNKVLREAIGKIINTTGGMIITGFNRLPEIALTAKQALKATE